MPQSIVKILVHVVFSIRERGFLIPPQIKVRLCLVACVCLIFASCGDVEVANVNVRESESNRAFEERERAELLAEEPLVLDDVDKFVKAYGFVGLRSDPPKNSEREIRIWIGVNTSRDGALIISEEKAMFLPPVGEEIGKKKLVAERLDVPNGMTALWADIENSGLLEIPREPYEERVEPFQDSNIVVVEMSKGAEYQYVMYHAPCYSKGDSAKILVNALDVINKAIGREFYSCA